MTMTPEETARVQAGYNELRQQRDTLADRCANLAQEVAARDIALEEARLQIGQLKSLAEMPSTDNFEASKSTE